MGSLRISSKKALIVVGVLILGLCVSLGTETGQKVLLGWVMKDWVRFDIPSQPIPLAAEVGIASDKISVCNRSSARWDDVVVRITNRVPLGDMAPVDTPLFAKVGNISSGACLDVPKAQFFSASWKKIPAPREINIVRVEILTSVNGPGYFAKEANLAGTVR